MQLIDLQYQGDLRAIATGVLELDDGIALVDPGPSSTLDTLRKGLEALGTGTRDVRAVLLTHIHLDHAGATGALLREAPDAEVYVSRLGARHLVDPAKLVRSAERIYGDRMQQLWGEIAPVPGHTIRALDGGEQIRIGGRTLDVAYTPGHAIHHVSYLDARTGTAFTGDTTGGRYDATGPVVPFTPPPDIDLDAWRGSLQKIAAWQPASLFVTHFGEHTDVEQHLAAHKQNLFAWAGRVRSSLSDAMDDDARAAAFARAYQEQLRAEHPKLAGLYMQQANAQGSWVGLARYWRRQGVG